MKTEKKGSTSENSTHVAIENLRIALCQPEYVQGSLEAQKAKVNELLEDARKTDAQFAVVPDVYGIRGVAEIVPLGSTSVISASNDAVLLDIDGLTLPIALNPNVSNSDVLVLDDMRPFVLAGYKTVARGVPTAIVRPVGASNYGQVVSCYQGSSELIGENGNICARLRSDFEQDMQVVSFNEESLPLLNPNDQLLDALQTTIRRFDACALYWKPKWIIGLSGGLDSSVVATLLVRTLGANRVIGYNLATKHNSEKTKGNAQALADALGIELKNGSIEDVVEATDNTLVRYGYDPNAQPTLVHENIQARLRGHLLTTFSAIEGGVVANNGNRVEGALGYATLYGDAIGALAPIADLTKVQLFDLSRRINELEGREVIPENLLPRVTEEGYVWETRPSAELSDGQYDPMKWFYHDWLIDKLQGNLSAGLREVMEGYLTDKLASNEVGKWVSYYGLDNSQSFIDDLEWVLRCMKNSAFKRIQGCPAIRLASPLTVHASPEVQGQLVMPSYYEELRAQILA